MCYTDVSFVLLKTNKFLIILEVSDTEHTVVCSGDITQLIPDDTVTQSQTLVTDAKDDNDTRVTINDEIVEEVLYRRYDDSIEEKMQVRCCVSDAS